MASLQHPCSVFLRGKVHILVGCKLKTGRIGLVHQMGAYPPCMKKKSPPCVALEQMSFIVTFTGDGRQSNHKATSINLSVNNQNLNYKVSTINNGIMSYTRSTKRLGFFMLDPQVKETSFVLRGSDTGNYKITSKRVVRSSAGAYAIYPPFLGSFAYNTPRYGTGCPTPCKIIILGEKMIPQ